jgi:hypothetical protein
VHLHFNRVARGPGWERWAILEDQLGDMAFAGEAILTFTDDSTYGEVDCSVLFTRGLEDDEAEELLNEVCSILSGRGNISVYTTQEVICRGFSLLPEDEEAAESN